MCVFSCFQDFSRHCVEINNKIITIMDDLISRNLFKVSRTHTATHSHTASACSPMFAIQNDRSVVIQSLLAIFSVCLVAVGSKVSSALCIIQDTHQAGGQVT